MTATPDAAPIAQSVREELDQTPEWWARQYRALIRKQIPRDAAHHDGHNIVEARTYGGRTLYRTCVDCNVGIDPYEET